MLKKTKYLFLHKLNKKVEISLRLEKLTVNNHVIKRQEFSNLGKASLTGCFASSLLVVFTYLLQLYQYWKLQGKT